MDENNQYNKHYSRYIRWSEEDNCWVCVVPELPGCQADGDTPQEVWDNAECIIQNWLQNYFITILCIFFILHLCYYIEYEVE